MRQRRFAASSALKIFCVYVFTIFNIFYEFCNFLFATYLQSKHKQSLFTQELQMTFYLLIFYWRTEILQYENVNQSGRLTLSGPINLCHYSQPICWCLMQINGLHYSWRWSVPERERERCVVIALSVDVVWLQAGSWRCEDAGGCTASLPLCLAPRVYLVVCFLTQTLPKKV